MPAGNNMPGTKVCLSNVGDAYDTATHRAHGADAFARYEPSRPAAASSEPTERQNSHSGARLTAAPPAAIAGQ